MVRIKDGEGNYTRAFLAAAEWAENLDFYPVADDGDYDRREVQEEAQAHSDP
jgi:hypothetical protein